MEGAAAVEELEAAMPSGSAAADDGLTEIGRAHV